MEINLKNYIGRFLPSDISSKFSSLNGSCVAAWLTAQGLTVISYRDTGMNGLAITKEGYAVSTNGYVSQTLSKS